MVEQPLPTGTVAFLFTDIEGSTKRWQRHREAMEAAVARHDHLLRAAIEGHGGYVFKTVGDAFCAAFDTVSVALAAALTAQTALAAEVWNDAGPIRVRMAVHVGAAEERDNDYFGPAVNRVARLLAAGHGGQVLLSLPAAELAHDALSPGVVLRDLGEHRLKDLERPEHVFQIVAPDLEADFPPLATLDHRPTNLPPQLTPFVGRERELADVCARIGRSDVRLVTLTGPGGTGKTRLSLQAAAELVDHYADGVWFVPLEEATTAEDLVLAIARVLGVREVPGRTPAEALAEHLRTKHTLLVLDNLEQIPEAGPAIGRLLLAAPGLKAIVSSRIRLGIRGEHEYAVPPLGLPPRDGRLLPPDRLADYDAISLFVDRAQAAKAGFALTVENAAAVVAICRELDGLPLAVELAAARVRMLPPSAILARLADRLGLLVGGGRDRPQRQQTLRGAIAWSYDLLPEPERALFARLAVFAGGWTLEAAEAVANPNGDLDVFEGLMALVDHSLVRQEETADGEPRFAMLALIRDFAREQLARRGGGEAELTAMLHAEHLLAVAEEAEPQLTGSDQADWLDRLDAEHENLRTALGWFEQADEAESLLRLAAALWRFWYMRGHLSDGRRWLEAALANAGDAEPVLLAKAFDGAGVLADNQGDYDGAQALLERALSLSRAAGDRRGTARALGHLGILAERRGDYDLAQSSYEGCAAAFRGLKDQHGLSRMLNALGVVSLEQTRYAEAISFFEESLHIGRRRKDEHHVAIVLNNLGEAWAQHGDAERAKRYYEEALTLYQTLGKPWLMAATMRNLATIALEDGDIDRAAALLSQSLSLCQRAGDRDWIAQGLEGSAAVAAACGQAVQAARLLGAADAIRDETGAPLPAAFRAAHERQVAAAREVLGAKAFSHAWAAGQALSTHEAATEAMEYALR